MSHIFVPSHNWERSYQGPQLFHIAKVFPLHFHDTCVENQLTVDVRVYFWNLNSIPFFDTAILRLVSFNTDYCRVALSFKTGSCKSSNFVVVVILQDCFVYAGYLTFPYKFKDQFVSFLKNCHLK